MTALTRNFELRRLAGRTDDGTVVEHALDEIFLNGIRLGFVGHNATDPINIIRPGVLTDKPTIDELVKLVQEKFGGEAPRVNGVPEFTDEHALDLREGRTE